MNPFEKQEEVRPIIWEGPEYDFREKNPDWFWAVGIITVCIAIGSIIYQNYLFAILIVVSITILLMFSFKKPETIQFEINDKGVKIKDALYSYKEMRNFWIDRHHKTIKLLINTNRVMSPLLDIPIPHEIKDAIGNHLAKLVKEEEIAEPASHRIMHYLGF